MKIIILFLFLFISSAGGLLYSQDENDIEENETSESIMQREEYIYTRRAGGPGKILPDNIYEKAVKQKMNILKDADNSRSVTSSAGWVSVNPTGMFYQITGSSYISGRTNVMAFHPTDANTFYIAAVQGGVWKTTNGGINWTVLTDNLGSISSGSIVIDISNPNILYYGTGELNYALDSQYGDGIYKSLDAGTSWTKIADASTVGSYISKIIINPSSTNILLCSSETGIFRSVNSGVNWTLELYSDISSLNIDPSNSQIIYAASGTFAAQSLVYKSTDNGITWAQINNGIPTNAGRMQLAVSPDNPGYVYASVANASGTLNGLYRTTNAGINWTLQNSTTNYLSSQGWYDNAVTVVPGNVNSVIVGGLDVYSSVNGGTTLTQRSNWSTTSASNLTHADIHYLGYNGTVLYCCSDGGVYKSTNNAVTWTDLNVNISTLQYESADYDPTNVNKLYGGTQDNNKQTSTNNGVIWIQRSTGDGGYTIVDPVNTNYIYGQYVFGSIQRSTNSGVSFTNFTPTGSTGGLFYNPYEIAPGDHNTIVFGRDNIYKTTSAQTATTAAGWTEIASTATVGGNVSAIGISYANINKIYIGTDNGRILETTNNGSSWNSQTGFDYVSDLIVDSADDNTCYATFGGNAYHVYKTTNGGSSWFNISGNLPAIGTNSIVIKRTSPRTIFTGTDLGVFQSTNEGTNWTSFNTGFPNVEVYDLKYKEGPKILLAATHGRGCFIFDFKTTIQTLNLAINFESYVPPDTITVELRNSTAPYSLVESKRGIGGMGISRQIMFSAAANGTPYYIVVKHRNSITTWSGSAQTFSTGTLSYDFTTSASQAYGNNMVLAGGKYSVYTGDVDINEVINLSDILIIFNDAAGFVTGYVVTDLNGDFNTNLTDLIYAFNNSSIFVNVMKP